MKSFRAKISMGPEIISSEVLLFLMIAGWSARTSVHHAVWPSILTAWLREHYSLKKMTTRERCYDQRYGRRPGLTSFPFSLSPTESGQVIRCNEGICLLCTSNWLRADRYAALSDVQHDLAVIGIYYMQRSVASCAKLQLVPRAGVKGWHPEIFSGAYSTSFWVSWESSKYINHLISGDIRP